MQGSERIHTPERSLVGFALGITLVGCSFVVDAPFDPRAESLSPPPVYQRWWTMVESCSGLTGRFESVSWYSTPGSDYVLSDGRQVGGYWAPVSNSILLAGNDVLAGELVRHEMLHALVRTKEGHKREYFLEKCGGVVSCSEWCLDDAGPASPINSSVPRVPSDNLELGVSVVPAAPSSAVDGGVFSVLVTATNRKPHPIVVTLDPSRLGRGFGYGIFGPGRGLIDGERIVDPSMIFFAAGETKSRYFDLIIGTGSEFRHIAPGIYSISGTYDRRYAVLENVLIQP